VLLFLFLVNVGTARHLFGELRAMALRAPYSGQFDKMAEPLPLNELVTLIIVPKDWYSHAVLGLWAVLAENPGVKVLYMIAPP